MFWWLVDFVSPSAAQIAEDGANSTQVGTHSRLVGPTACQHFLGRPRMLLKKESWMWTKYSMYLHCGEEKKENVWCDTAMSWKRRESFSGTSQDDYLRDTVSHKYEVEGLCHTYRTNLCANVWCIQSSMASNGQFTQGVRMLHVVACVTTMQMRLGVGNMEKDQKHSSPPFLFALTHDDEQIESQRSCPKKFCRTK